LETDVVVPCSTNLAKEFSNSFEKTSKMVEVPADALASLIMIAVSQHGEMLSSDRRSLALFCAVSRARKMGVPESVVLEVADAVKQYGSQISESNPLSGMF